MTDRYLLLKQIKETESNIKNWYKQEWESEAESNYDLRQEKKYLRQLKSELGNYGEERIKILMDNVECF